MRSLARFVLLASLTCAAQQSAAPHRTRLILKDGSYQIVMSYQVAGQTVRYVSAERGGATEDIPLDLVDLDATRKWERQHSPGAAATPDAPDRAPAIDPELLKEEAERASFAPLVAPDLHLPEQDSVLALDTWQGAPELVPLVQSDGDLNRSTGHNMLKATLNPFASAHQVVQLKGERAAVQVHVDRPVLYLRIGDESDTAGSGQAFTVDTGGANNQPQRGNVIPATSRYVIVRTEVRTNARVVYSFKTSLLGGTKQQDDVVETTTEQLPGGHWMKVTPDQPLLIGEYALLEVISDKEINLGVWDFGVHPTAPENRDAIKPEPKRPFSLERRRP
ncbi:hypothetical protein SAMN05421770_10728 [Granulicella rosea]|uniref:Uncharacterized protein n=1 Tax=Granulicella rosea TaxID=474952 RepID=A0A239LGJ9_9BACT|nr:hypothetical protein [Granulicella rosea]SNT29787.1 hypothetical protein SAMN05421770_10728 [Granulicella rosea]